MRLCLRCCCFYSCCFAFVVAAAEILFARRSRATHKVDADADDAQQLSINGNVMRQCARSLSTHTHTHTGSGVASLCALSLSSLPCCCLRAPHTVHVCFVPAAAMAASASAALRLSLTRLTCRSLCYARRVYSVRARLAGCVRVVLCIRVALCLLACVCVCVARRVSAFHLLLLPPFRFIRLSARVLYSSNSFTGCVCKKKKKKPLKAV